MNRKLRLFYAAGAGDVIASYRCWRGGGDDPSQVTVTYSSQFWDVCRGLDAESLTVSSHPKADTLADGRFRLEHRPKLAGEFHGIAYHLAEIWYGLAVMASIVRFRADFAIVTDGTTDWFILGVLRTFGVHVIPAMHTLLRPKYKVQSRFQRILQAWNGVFFRRQTHAILSVSSELTAQLNTPFHTPGRPRRIIQFLPLYRRAIFHGIAAPPAQNPFRVFFAGRIERNKGVFTLLEIASGFQASGERGIVFDILGDGSVLAELRAAAGRAGLSESFRCHGLAGRELLIEVLGRSHAVIVPTTTDCAEGLNKMVLEGVLAGRPVITSAVCPALDLVRDAVVEVAPDDAAGYRDAILQLRGDPALYDRKRRACLDYQDRFYDEANSWAAALSSALSGPN